jgi:hypothetical protein
VVPTTTIGPVFSDAEKRGAKMPNAKPIAMQSSAAEIPNQTFFLVTIEERDAMPDGIAALLRQRSRLQ